MPSPGFGELDDDQEDDFGSLLAPRKAVAPAGDPAPPTQLTKPEKAQTAAKAKKATASPTKKAAEKPKKAAQTPEPPSSGQTAAPAADKPAKKAARRGRPPGSGARTSTSQSTTSPLVLWTPERIRARMQSLRMSKGTHYLDQVLDALEASIDELPDLVDEQVTPHTVQTGLFVREQAAPTSTEPRKQLTIRGVLQSQLDVIDQLVDSTGAGSRSRLINIALDKYLP